MGVSNPTLYFGIHSVAFRRLSDGSYYGPPVKVTGGFNLDLPAEFADLTGGSEKFIIATEETTFTPEATFNIKEFRLYLYELFVGATTTEIAAEANGNVSVLENVQGTSVENAVDGIASLTALAGSEGNLKFAKYTMVATGADTVNILASSDIDFRRGTDVEYQNDELEVLAVDVVVPPLDATVDITELGLQITGGSAAAIVMVADDTAKFEVRPINSGAEIVKVGETGKILPEFSCILYAQQRGNGEMVEIEIYKAKGGGFPHNFAEKAWMESELTIKPLKDFQRDGVFELRRVRPS